LFELDYNVPFNVRRSESKDILDRFRKQFGILKDVFLQEVVIHFEFLKNQTRTVPVKPGEALLDRLYEIALYRTGLELREGKDLQILWLENQMP
jgi:hypothetical protein